jgi:2-iminoacetate synthase
LISDKERTSDTFINDNLILQLLHEAKAKAQDKNLVKNIIAKASQYHGLSASEVAILLEVTDKDLLQSMYTVAADIKQAIYGTRIVLFAPLYISSHCINNCSYCGYRSGNKNQIRRHLSLSKSRRKLKLFNP